MMLVFLLALFLFCGCSQGKDIVMVVETAGFDWGGSGTDAEIRIQIFGTKGNVPNRKISGSFEKGSVDTITIRGYDIGFVTGMTIHRNEDGLADNWKLDKITIKISGQIDSIFNYYGWVSSFKWHTLTLSCPNGYSVNSGGWCSVSCSAGYRPNSQGTACEDVNECQANPSARCASPTQCMNTVGSFYCNCPSGYTKKAGTFDQCEDLDECKNNPCDSGKSTCKNTPGSYRCECKKGYQNLDAKQCINADECTLGNHTCNTTSSRCVDTEGDFYCRCKDGFTQGVNNKICDPIACIPLNTPAGGTLEPRRCTQANANINGDKCAMKCNDGYVIDDIQHGVLTCKSGVTWEGNMGRCNPVACPALPVISNGRIFPSTCSSTGGTYTEKCVYSCNNGYLLEGRSSRQCLAQGTWEGAQPSCIKIEVKPWIVCPGNIKQDLQPDKSTADVSSVWKEPTSNVQQITINPPEISSSYQFPAGETKVEWTATNPAGSASCAIYVTITDVTPPTIHNCPQDIYEVSDSPKAVTWVEPTFTDNVKVTKVDKSHNSGDTFQLLETNVRYEVLDAKLNRASCLFKVTLKRPPCHDPDGPLDGTKTCSNYLNVNFCQVQCPSGSVLYKATAIFWQCHGGVWQPTETIPDCVVSVKKDPNMPCEEGRIEMTEIVGNTLHCTKCPKGMYKSSTTDCSPCPVGTYNDQQGQTQCSQKCPAGTSSLPGAKSAVECKTPCPPGRYSANGLGPNCPYCPFDTYQDQAMKTSCIPCPNGTFTVGKGAKSRGECGTSPKVTSIDPPVSNIKEEESVSVNCYATGSPEPTYKWSFLTDIHIPDGFLGVMSQQPLLNKDGDVIGSRLTITDAKYDNTGSYECSVTNTHGNDKGLAKINVEKVIDYGGSGQQPS